MVEESLGIKFDTLILILRKRKTFLKKNLKFLNFCLTDQSTKTYFLSCSIYFLIGIQYTTIKLAVIMIIQWIVYRDLILVCYGYYDLRNINQASSCILPKFLYSLFQFAAFFRSKKAVTYGRFHQHFMLCFYVRRTQKRKKDWRLDCIFWAFGIWVHKSFA